MIAEYTIGFRLCGDEAQHLQAVGASANEVTAKGEMIFRRLIVYNVQQAHECVKAAVYVAYEVSSQETYKVSTSGDCASDSFTGR